VFHEIGETGFVGIHSRERLRWGALATINDPTHAIRAVACIRFVRRWLVVCGYHHVEVLWIVATKKRIMANAISRPMGTI